MSKKIVFNVSLACIFAWCTLNIASPKQSALHQAAVSGTVTKINPTKLEDLKDSPHAGLIENYAKTKRTKHKKTEKKKEKRNPDHIPTKAVAGKTELIISASLPLTGEEQELGKQIHDGMNLFFNKLKKDDSKNPILIGPMVLDNQSDIPKGKKNINELRKQSPLFLNLFGTNVIKSEVIPLTKKGKITALFPLEGLASLRNSDNNNILYYRPSHEAELKALIDYTVNKLEKTMFAVFYEASTWGEGTLETLRTVLKSHNLELVAEGRYQQKTVNIADALSKISKAIPDVIVCLAQPLPTMNFIDQALSKGILQSTFLGLSSLNSIQKTVKQSLGNGVRLITSSVVPDPEKSKSQIAQDYRADMKTFMGFRELSPYSFESYICAHVFYEGIKMLSAPYSRQTLMKNIENLKEIKGLPLSFDPTTRTLSNKVWINDGSGSEWFLPNEKTS